jgi:hypothetical protein
MVEGRKVNFGTYVPQHLLAAKGSHCPRTSGVESPGSLRRASIIGVCGE